MTSNSIRFYSQKNEICPSSSECYSSGLGPRSALLSQLSLAGFICRSLLRLTRLRLRLRSSIADHPTIEFTCRATFTAISETSWLSDSEIFCLERPQSNTGIGSYSTFRSSIESQRNSSVDTAGFKRNLISSVPSLNQLC